MLSTVLTHRIYSIDNPNASVQQSNGLQLLSRLPDIPEHSSVSPIIYPADGFFTGAQASCKSNVNIPVNPEYVVLQI